MIETVTMTKATWAPAPKRFEAGVPNMGQAVGLSAALDYLDDVGLEKIHEWELFLTGKALDGLRAIDGVHIVGPQTLEKR
jgi:cysteine desulfurase/selenocysteine lyase